VALALEFGDLQDEDVKNKCSSYVMDILFTAIALLSVSIVIELSLLIVSFRGSIFNDIPRKSARLLIYIRSCKLSSTYHQHNLIDYTSTRVYAQVSLSIYAYTDMSKSV